MNLGGFKGGKARKRNRRERAACKETFKSRFWGKKKKRRPGGENREGGTARRGVSKRVKSLTVLKRTGTALALTGVCAKENRDTLTHTPKLTQKNVKDFKGTGGTRERERKRGVGPRFSGVNSNKKVRKKRH